MAGPVRNPRFFAGFLTSPAVAAGGLQSVALVARARYFQPAQTVSRDPVVTCGGDRLRFESFSGCCGVYARLDVLSDGLDGEVLDRGTTNVDINEPLRRMLARVGGRDPLHLAVGADELAVSTVDGSAVEKKVDLPARWLRGFAEVQVLTAAFEPRAELSALEAARFLRGLPGGSRAAGAGWAVPSGRSLRLAARPAPGAVCLAGPQRLAALLPLLPHAEGLRVYGPAVGPGSLEVSSAWELALPGMRLVLVLSPEVRRGFSGEGAVLDALTGEQVGADAELLGALLNFEPRVEVAELAERAGLSVSRTRAALVGLGTSGRVGYDLAEAAFFHRELPYDEVLVERANLRLRAAIGLAKAGAVRWTAAGIAVVTVDDHAHWVRFVADGAALSCTCTWWSKHRDGRGACSHVLAAQLVRAVGGTGELSAPANEGMASDD